MARIKHYNTSTKQWEYSDIAISAKGEKGEKGDKGDTGSTPNLTIGTVTTLNAGTSATATITGSPENPKLNLGIPKGVDGSGGGITKVFQIAASTASNLDTNLFLLDTADNNILKYYNGSAWVPVPIGWG